MTTTYDSTAETQNHIGRVRELICEATLALSHRGLMHDQSKLESPEKEAFDSLGPPETMAALKYGSPEYREQLRKIKTAIDHHYAANSHHPEHFRLWKCPLCKSIFDESQCPEVPSCSRPARFCPKCCVGGSVIWEAELDRHCGVEGMSLIDLLEMLADWKAAGERHATGSMEQSFKHNQGRFHIEPQLQRILENTAKELGWL